MRRVAVVCLCIGVLFGAGAARADDTFIAAGSVAVTPSGLIYAELGGSASCSDTLGIAFHQTNGGFELREVLGPDSSRSANLCDVQTVEGDQGGLYTNQGQQLQPCVANVGPHFYVSTFSRKGNTFTIYTRHSFCDGTYVPDTIVFTLNASSISYVHDIPDNPKFGGMHIQGTLMRIA
ncbi:MAG: hypothetical protein ACYDCC_15805 [Actinomycetota bacterium]